MILFSILAVTAIILIAVVVIAIAVGGASFILIFGDVIVCIAIIAFLIKKIFFNKKK